MRKFLKVYVSLLVCFVMLSFNLVVPVRSYVLADTTTDKSKSLIQFYRTANSLDRNSITNSDLMAFGVFVSNFFQPLTTNIKTNLTGLDGNLGKLFFASADKNADDIKWIMGLVRKVMTDQRKKLKLKSLRRQSRSR